MISFNFYLDIEICVMTLRWTGDATGTSDRPRLSVGGATCLDHFSSLGLKFSPCHGTTPDLGPFSPRGFLDSGFTNPVLPKTAS